MGGGREVLHVEGYYVNRPFTHTEESAELTNGEGELEFDAGAVEEPHVVAQRLVEYDSDVPAKEFIAMDCNRQHFTMRLEMRKGKRPKMLVIAQDVDADHLTTHTFRSEEAAAAWCAQQPDTMQYFGFRFADLEYVAMTDDKAESLTKQVRK